MVSASREEQLIEMATEVRCARADEYPLVRELIRVSFKDDEAELWDYLVENDPSLRPEGVSLCVADGRPVACTVALPRKVRGPQGWLPGAIITLVCTHPDFRLRGHGASTVRDAVAWVTEQGGVLSFLYGVRAYYPRFGFVPVLPRLETVIPAAAVSAAWEGRDVWAGCAGGARQLDPAEDLPAVTRLYTEHLTGYPLAVAREPQPWQWRFREARGRAILLLDGGASAQAAARGPSGYAVVAPDANSETLIVSEAAADGPGAGAARGLLAALAHEAQGRGLKTVKLLEPAGHVMTRLALMLGAEQAYKPAAAGMVYVNSWRGVLPPGYEVTGAGEATSTILTRNGLALFQGTHAAIVQLAMGYRSIDDLLLMPECELVTGQPGVPATEVLVEALRRDFPLRSPRWHLAPYW